MQKRKQASIVRVGSCDWRGEERRGEERRRGKWEKNGRCGIVVARNGKKAKSGC